jgi:hypothetical protein
MKRLWNMTCSEMRYVLRNTHTSRWPKLDWNSYMDVKLKRSLQLHVTCVRQVELTVLFQMQTLTKNQVIARLEIQLLYKPKPLTLVVQIATWTCYCIEVVFPATLSHGTKDTHKAYVQGCVETILMLRITSTCPLHWLSNVVNITAWLVWYVKKLLITLTYSWSLTHNQHCCCSKWTCSTRIRNSHTHAMQVLCVNLMFANTFFIKQEA